MSSSTQQIRERLDAIRGQVQELVDASGTAGLSIGVLHEGEIIHNSHYGYTNLQTKEVPNDDTVYHLGSLTKAFAAAGLGVLVSQGKLKWEQVLSESSHLSPRFHQRDKDIESQANLIDLLAHRMGLAMRMNYWAQMEQELLLDPNEAINVLGDLNKTAEFRSTIKYNNWTFAVATLLIEKITGRSLEDFMQETFFRPLGLNRTTFAATAQDNAAAGHITLSDGVPFEVKTPTFGSGTLLAGAAGMKSTVSDLLKLYDAMLSALEHQKDAGVNTTPGNPFAEANMLFTSHNKKGNTEYGLGWFLTELPADIGWIGINDGRVKQNPIIGKGVPPTPIAYHNGNTPGFVTSVHLIPKTHTAIVILSNTLAFSDIPDYAGGLILNTILGSDDQVDFLSLVGECKETSIQGPLKTAAQLKAEKKEGTTHKALESYAGHYVNDAGNFALTVTVLENGLRVRINNRPNTYYDLQHYHDDVFAWDCDRDAEAKRAMFPQLSVEFRKLYFVANEEGVINSIHWAYARDEPKGEIFHKKDSA